MGSLNHLRGRTPSLYQKHTRVHGSPPGSRPAPQESQLPAFPIKVKLTPGGPPGGGQRQRRRRQAIAGLAGRKWAAGKAHFPPAEQARDRTPLAEEGRERARPVAHAPGVHTHLCRCALTRGRARLLTSQSLMSGARVARRLQRLSPRLLCGLGIRLAAAARAAVAFARRQCRRVIARPGSRRPLPGFGDPPPLLCGLVVLCRFHLLGLGALLPFFSSPPWLPSAGADSSLNPRRAGLAKPSLQQPSLLPPRQENKLPLRKSWPPLLGPLGAASASASVPLPLPGGGGGGLQWSQRELAVGSGSLLSASRECETMERDFLSWNSAPPFLARNSHFAPPSLSPRWTRVGAF